MRIFGDAYFHLTPVRSGYSYSIIDRVQACPSNLLSMIMQDV